MPDLISFTEKLQDTKSVEHSKLLEHAKRLIELSRTTMAAYYRKWDEHDAMFRTWRHWDKEDRAAFDKGEPEKLIMPLTFSQVMTFVGFSVSTLMQNDKFFELTPSGSESNPLREPLEEILQRDLKKNAWTSFLTQFFLDVGRFSLGCAEVCYTEQFRNIRLPQTQQVMGSFGNPTEEQTYEFKQIPVFQGNKVFPLSPYRFFPDTRVPLTRFQDGEFCGSEDMFSTVSLKSTAGAIFNLDKIPKLNEDQYKNRRTRSRIETMETIRMNPTMGAGGDPGDGDAMVKSGSVIVTKLVLDLIPKDFKASAESTPFLGDEDFPVRYIVWYANDQTIIKFEEATYLHGQFPYVCAQFIADQHMSLNQGLASMCGPINKLVTWLMNAHTASQKNSFESKWVIDPAGVDMKSLESRSPYIFLKKNMASMGVERYVKQMTTVDTTQNAMQDISGLKDLLEGATGYTGMMQGQYSAGRRDATQSRVVTQGATTRGKTTLSSIWESAFAPLGRQLIANNRQEMDFETFSRIIGPQPGDNGTIPDPLHLDSATLFQLFQADAITIATDEQFFVFDGSMPSEKAFLAQTLQELFIAIAGNPVIMQVMGYGPEQLKFLLEEMYELRGVPTPVLPPPAPAQQPGMPGGAPQQPGLMQPLPQNPAMAALGGGLSA